ncbi:MAG: hypothetical protein JWM12_3915 [Ilumatobacteraceae bacterium]|nr:hypothetical protein [Ilumatobacteraceae bacterium]
MSAGFLGFVLGVAVAVALAELGAARRRSGVATRHARLGQPTDWDSTMPPPRSSLRPRWESSSDPADEDDLIEFLVTVVVVALLAGGIFFGASSLARFVTFFVCGSALGAGGIGVYAWIIGRNLPPGGRHVVVRGVVVAIVAGVALHWFLRTAFRDLTFDRIHASVLKVKLVHRPGEVHKLFDTDGVLLYASLAVGVMFAIGLLLTVLVDVMAMLAATRLGEGSRNAFDGWLAQLYPRRQLRLWISTAIVGTITILLVAGAALGWYDHYRQNNDIKPAPAPIIANPPGTVVPLTVPSTVAVGATVPPTTVAPPPETTAAAAVPAAPPAS